jgi:hypothetical protein
MIVGILLTNLDVLEATCKFSTRSLDDNITGLDGAFDSGRDLDNTGRELQFHLRLREGERRNKGGGIEEVS